MENIIGGVVCGFCVCGPDEAQLVGIFGKPRFAVVAV